MSWPEDGKPRFVLSEVSGYSAGNAGGGHAMQTDVSVLDRANAHRVVFVFPCSMTAWRGLNTRRRKAAELARALNRDPESVDLDDFRTSSRHGSGTRYKFGCRCTACSSYRRVGKKIPTDVAA